ncbi:MAG: aryl-sulfate sulfotransferase [Bacteroidetes bacterium]|nr:aryl-sulfate sulfotransferase [Bacteroidota bacterium]
MKFLLPLVRRMFFTIIVILAVPLSLTLGIHAQKPTVGLLQYVNEQEQQDQQEGYVLFAPISSTTTYLIDKCGRKVHSWNSTYKPGLSVYLLPDGSILRTGNTGNPIFQLGGGTGGIIEKISWEGSVVWSYKLSSMTTCLHHDIKPLPNGNILVVMWSAMPAEQAIAVGRTPSKTGTTIWNEKIIELAPEGTNSASIVWEWSSWDHLIQDFDQSKSNFGVVADHPELINTNYITNPNPSNPDWLHFNSIDFNPELNQIMVSVHTFGEVWIIDHSTTTTEAATHVGGASGKGGDLLYRWGNPIAYNRGTADNRIIYGQHNASWIPKGLVDGGKIMVFNNGYNRSDDSSFSSVDIFSPTLDSKGNYTLAIGKPYSPEVPDWRYTDDIPSKFFSTSHSSAQRLPNGNTLICAGTQGLAFEIAPDKKIIWEYKNPITINGIAKQGDNVGVSTNIVFRMYLYPIDFKGFTNRTFESGEPIELDPYPSLCSTTFVEFDDKNTNITVFPQPAEDLLEIQFPERSTQPTEILLINLFGNIMSSKTVSYPANSCTVDVSNIPAGMYALKISNQSYTTVKKVNIVK